PINFLIHEASLAVKEGLDPIVAIEALTINPAAIFGLEDRLGSLAVGRGADIVIWATDPPDLDPPAEPGFASGRRAPDSDAAPATRSPSCGPLPRSTSPRAPRRSSSPAAGSSTSTPRQEPRTSPIHTARHSSASRERRESRRRHHRRGAGRGTDRVRPRPRFV